MKIEKIHTKIKIEEVKIYIFWETWWISTKCLGKMWLMMILKVIKNKALHSLQILYFLKYIVRVKAWIFFVNFLNETSI